MLPSLIQLMPNSAKIMSTSGTTAIRFIVRVSNNSIVGYMTRTTCQLSGVFQNAGLLQKLIKEKWTLLGGYVSDVLSTLNGIIMSTTTISRTYGHSDVLSVVSGAVWAR